MRILLTHGYFIAKDPHENGIMKPYAPLGLLYLSAWLKKEGIPNEIFDSTFSTLDALKANLEENQPEIIGLYATLMTKMNVIAIISFIKASALLQHARIVIGGPDARFHAAGYLRHGVDVVVPGEGEKALTEIIRVFNLGDTESLSGIPGIIFMKSDGTIVNTGVAQSIDMDDLPVLSRESIDIRLYLDKWKGAHGYSSLTINAMRGCPYSCYWCSKSIYGNTYRRRNPEAVVLEMKQLRDKYHPDQLWFTDDVFTISREWLRKFSEEVIRQHIFIPYECISRSDCLDDEMLQLLRLSGCKKLWIGAESGSQKVIGLMNRRIDILHTIDIIKLARKIGISTGTFIMLGYPGEMKRDIMQTAAYLKSASPDELTIGTAYPIEGTRFYEQAEPGFTRPFNWEQASEREIVFRKPYSDQFYRFAIRYLFNISKAMHTKNLFDRMVCQVKALIAKGYISLLN